MVAVDDGGSVFGDVLLVDDGDVAEEEVAAVEVEEGDCVVDEWHGYDIIVI